MTAGERVALIPSPTSIRRTQAAPWFRAVRQGLPRGLAETPKPAWLRGFRVNTGGGGGIRTRGRLFGRQRFSSPPRFRLAKPFAPRCGPACGPAAALKSASSNPAASPWFARHEVAVAIERDRDRAVPHVGREGLGIHARGNHQRGKGVAALVQGDPRQPCRLPGLVGALLRRPRIERPAPSANEAEPGRAPATKSMDYKVLAQLLGDRTRSSPGSRLRLDELLSLRVPSPLDAAEPRPGRGGSRCSGRPSCTPGFGRSRSCAESL